MSLFEVVICLAILATALAALMGNVYTLNQAHRTNEEVDRASEIVRLLAERIQGANWNRLGADDAPWSWQRLGPVVAASPAPLDPNTPIDPTPDDTTDPIPAWVRQPMTETAANPVHNLTSDQVGVLAEASGLTDLRVWVEYRRMSALNGVAAMSSWNAELQDLSQIVDVSNPADFNPTDFDDALVVRIIARWRSVAGGDRHYELSFARRR